MRRYKGTYDEVQRTEGAYGEGMVVKEIMQCNVEGGKGRSQNVGNRMKGHKNKRG